MKKTVMEWKSYWEKPWGPLTPTEIKAYVKRRSTVSNNGCWVWDGATNPGGYGILFSRGIHWLAHRFSLFAEKGALNPKLEIDHLCRNRKCVNPKHLEEVTRRVNTLRGISPAATHAKKTHCINGHAFDYKNTYINQKGSRTCRECRAKGIRKIYQRMPYRRTRFKNIAWAMGGYYAEFYSKGQRYRSPNFKALKQAVAWKKEKLCCLCKSF